MGVIIILKPYGHIMTERISQLVDEQVPVPGTGNQGCTALPGTYLLFTSDDKNGHDGGWGYRYHLLQT